MIGHYYAGLILFQMLFAAQLPTQANERSDTMAPCACPATK